MDESTSSSKIFWCLLVPTGYIGGFDCCFLLSMINCVEQVFVQIAQTLLEFLQTTLIGNQ